MSTPLYGKLGDMYGRKGAFITSIVIFLIGSALRRVAKRLSGHRVHTALASDLPMIPLDFVLAEQVLVNVLENAGKFSAAGTNITVSAEQPNDELVIRVEDQGPGIPEHDLPRIFERFFRAPVGDHRPAGVGLGLSVCKGFVEAMGGSITARNREDGAVDPFGAQQMAEQEAGGAGADDADLGFHLSLPARLDQPHGWTLT